MFTRILVGLDGSELAEAALPLAERLARASNADLLLVRAISVDRTGEPFVDVDPTLLPTAPAVSWEKRVDDTASTTPMLQEAAAYLEGIAARLNRNGFGCEVVVTAGDPTGVLLDETRRLGADMIVVGTHARSELGRVIYGSVAETVLARSSVPVLMVRSTRTTRPETTDETASPIIVPLDGSPVAEAALPWAIDLARLLAVKLHLVRVVRPAVVVVGDELAGLDVASAVVPEEVDERLAADYLNATAESTRRQGIRTTTEVVVGQAWFAIARAAQEQQAALIVMATHGRTGVARALLGSVAMRILHHSDVPALLVRPSGLLHDLAQRKMTDRTEQSLSRHGS